MRAYVNDDNSLTVNLGNGMGSFTGYPKELFGVGTKLDIRNDYIEELWGVKTTTDGTGIDWWVRSPNRPDKFDIKKVIFNDPATIVFWADGTKTVVKCADFDIFDPEKGLAMAICKRVYGERFHSVFKEFLPEEDVESAYPAGPKTCTGYEDWINALKNITISINTNTKEDK